MTQLLSTISNRNLMKFSSILQKRKAELDKEKLTNIEFLRKFTDFTVFP